MKFPIIREISHGDTGWVNWKNSGDQILDINTA